MLADRVCMREKVASKALVHDSGTNRSSAVALFNFPALKNGNSQCREIARTDMVHARTNLFTCVWSVSFNHDRVTGFRSVEKAVVRGSDAADTGYCCNIYEELLIQLLCRSFVVSPGNGIHSE